GLRQLQQRRVHPRRSRHPEPPNRSNNVANTNVIVGLEIGTSKVCAVVREAGEQGVVSLIGVGQAKSRGVRKGEIVDSARATEDIRNAIADAEQMADAEIRSVYLGV